MLWALCTRLFLLSSTLLSWEPQPQARHCFPHHFLSRSLCLPVPLPAGPKRYDSHMCTVWKGKCLRRETCRHPASMSAPPVKEPSSHGTRGCSGCGSQTPHQGIGLSLDTLGKDLCEANAYSGPLSRLIGAILIECGLAIGLDIRKCFTDTEGPRQGSPESPGMPGSRALCSGSLCLSFYFAFSLTPAL